MTRLPRESTTRRRILIGCKGKFVSILVTRRPLPPFGRRRRRVRPVTWINHYSHDIARIFG